jgi:hypothetical protein
VIVVEAGGDYSRSVYFLHKLLWELRRDPALAARFGEDPDGVLDGYELDPVERAAIVARDFRTLYDRGANPYLLYFCALQIGVSRADYYEQLRAGRPAGAVLAEPVTGGVRRDGD